MMSWTELRIHTTAEAIDWISTLLASIDYQEDIHIAKYGVSENPHRQNPDSQNPNRQNPNRQNPDSETENSPTVSPNWAFTVCLYFSEQNSQAQINQIDKLLSPLHRVGLTSRAEFTHVAEKPPSREAALNQIHRIGQRFVIVPLHSSSTAESLAAYQPPEIILKLGTSRAFGSGLHPTTALCLQLLERYVQPGMNALDLGSGSGILSVALEKLGAQVLAIDNDPIAVEATIAAANDNHTEQLVVMQGSLGSGSQLGHWMGGEALSDVATIEPNGDFDLIVSNVFARIQTALAESFAHALQRTTPQNGILITSGYTEDYQEQINEAMIAAGFEAIDRLQADEWIAIVHRLRNESPSSSVF